MKRRTNLPKFHYFNGKKYNFKWRKPYKAWGICDDPVAPSDERFIMVDPKLPNEDFAETVIHEALHAEQWYLDEETVTRIAANLALLLDRCGLLNKSQ